GRPQGPEPDAEERARGDEPPEARRDSLAGVAEGDQGERDERHPAHPEPVADHAGGDRDDQDRDTRAREQEPRLERGEREAVRVLGTSGMIALHIASPTNTAANSRR